MQAARDWKSVLKALKAKTDCVNIQDLGSANTLGYQWSISCLSRVASWVNTANKHSLAERWKEFAAARGPPDPRHSCIPATWPWWIYWLKMLKTGCFCKKKKKGIQPSHSLIILTMWCLQQIILWWNLYASYPLSLNQTTASNKHGLVALSCRFTWLDEVKVTIKSTLKCS